MMQDKYWWKKFFAEKLNIVSLELNKSQTGITLANSFIFEIFPATPYPF